MSPTNQGSPEVPEGAVQIDGNALLQFLQNAQNRPQTAEEARQEEHEKMRSCVSANLILSKFLAKFIIIATTIMLTVFALYENFEEAKQCKKSNLWPLLASMMIYHLVVYTKEVPINSKTMHILDLIVFLVMGGLSLMFYIWLIVEISGDTCQALRGTLLMNVGLYWVGIYTSLIVISCVHSCADIICKSSSDDHSPPGQDIEAGMDESSRGGLAAELPADTQ